MHAKTSYTAKLMLSVVAVLLLAAPISAQTLQSSASSVTIGQVISCNTSQVVNITSSGGSITFKTSISYAQGDVHGAWLAVQDQSTGNMTTGARRSPLPWAPGQLSGCW